MTRQSRAALAAFFVLVSGAAPAADEGLDFGGMDTRVHPGDDFYRYANGGWSDRTEIRPDRGSAGPFDALQDVTDRRLVELLEKVPDSATGDARRAADYYAAFMDTRTIERLGAGPLQTPLAAIAAIRDRQELAGAIGATIRADVDALNMGDFQTPNLFGIWVAQDLEHPERYAAFLLQGGLSLPDREYYLDSSAEVKAVRDAFRAHVERLFGLAGLSEAAARADRVVELETRIAQAQVSMVASQDPKNARRWRAEDFPRQAPGLAWPALFAAAGLGSQPEFVVWQPGAVKALARLVADRPLESWRDLLAYHLIKSRATVLSQAFVDENFTMYGQTLSGMKQNTERWKRGIGHLNLSLGDAAGRLYAEKYFPAGDKAVAAAMVRDIVTAFGKRVDTLGWMASQTKARAKAKLATLVVGVGYPDTFRSYDGLVIRRNDAYGNHDRAQLFAYRAELAKLGRPVDRYEWVMLPQAVNAINMPVMNALSFPAAILQPPYFDAKRPAAMNYAAIGAVIGHEISHSFDASGALFDARGRLRNWWTPADFRHFEQAGQQLVRQYDAYHPLPDLAIKGQQTLSENIADLAGLAAAYDAWKLSLKGAPAPVVHGMTGEQQFFLSFGQTWRGKFREPLLRQIVMADGHSPPEFRALTVRNLDAWYAVYGVEPDRKLYLPPESRVRVW